MRAKAILCLVCLGGILILPPLALAAPEPVSAERVHRALQLASRYLVGQQRQTGNRRYWDDFSHFQGGVTCLCTLALLNAGTPADDPVIAGALVYLRSLGRPNHVYSAALQVMVFCEVGQETDLLLVRRNVQWLEHAQRKESVFNGGWGYTDASDSADNSNSQFALLALHEAERRGIEVQDATWRRADRYWKSQQLPNGAWGYKPPLPNGPSPPTGSMTAAGIASLIITSGRVTTGGATVEGERVQCCGQAAEAESIARGLMWLGENFSVQRNPGPNLAESRRWYLYYMYGIERVGRLSGHRFIGTHDWYREGAEVLLRLQDPLTGSFPGQHAGAPESRPDIGTALAVLFLAKGRRPVLMSKLQHSAGDDWRHHRQDIAHLTGHVEIQWKQNLIWQSIDLRAAATEDLLQSPVLFISGRDAWQPTPQQTQHLQQYVQQGGFLFVESCCNGKVFDQQFRKWVTASFPDSAMRLLPPEHPIWYAEQRVNPSYLRPLWGMDACCRTGIVYCPGDLSCYWELAGPRRDDKLPPRVQEEVDACLTIGTNVLAYATNRQLKNKLETAEALPQVAQTPEQARGALRIAKLRHTGGSDDAPSAALNLLRAAQQQLDLRVRLETPQLEATDEALADYAVLFVHGRRAFEWSPPEREALARYLNSGGFILADAICASKPFAESFRREMREILPAREWQPIPAEHPIWSSQFSGFDLKTVTLQEPATRSDEAQPLRVRQVRTPPALEAIEVEGRLAVVFSPYDLSCALENSPSLECRGYAREDAARIGLNAVLYALQQ